MSTICDTIESYGDADALVFPFSIQLEVSSSEADSPVTISIVQRIIEDVLTDEVIIDSSHAMVNESAGADEVLLPQAIAREFYEDAADAIGELASRLDLLVESDAETEDTVFQGPAIQLVESEADAGSDVFVKVYANQLVSNTVVVESLITARAVLEAVVADSDAEGTVTSSKVRIKALVVEEPAAEDVVFAKTRVVFLSADTGGGDDTGTTHARISKMLATEAADSDEESTDSDSSGDAYVMNTESTAVCNYADYPIESMVQLPDGRVLAAGVDGLQELGGVGGVAFRVKTGLRDYGSDAIKRVESIQMGVSGLPMTVMVEATDRVDITTPQAQATESRYASYPGNTRVKVGKGLAGRWWRVTLSGISVNASSPGQISDAAVNVAPSTRKLR